MNRHDDVPSTEEAATRGDERNDADDDNVKHLTLPTTRSSDTFWSKEYASRIAQRLKKTRCTVGHVDQRIRKEKHDQQNPLNTKKADKKGIHRSLDVFPEWMIQSEAFEEVDKLIKLNRLDNALGRTPHARSHDDAKVVGDYLIATWETAAELGDESVALLSRCVTLSTVAKGTYILTQNRESQKFYIVIGGKVDIHRIEAMKKDGSPGDGIIVTLGAGSAFGEAAVKNGTLCNASCIAHDDGVKLLVLTKTDYDTIMAEHQEKEKRDAFDVLKKVPMFKGWGRSRLASVVNLVRRKKFPPGIDIMRQGDLPDYVYFISSGKIKIWKDIPIKTVNTWPTGPHSWKKVTRTLHKPFFLVEIGRGGFFGEKAIVEDTVRAATCTSSTDAVLYMLDKTDFMKLLNQGHKSHELDVKHKAAHGYPDDNDILRLWTTLGGVPKKKPPPKLSKTADKIAVQLAKEKAEKAEKAAKLAEAKAAGAGTPRREFGATWSARPQSAGVLPAMNSSLHTRSQLMEGSISSAGTPTVGRHRKPAFARTFEQQARATSMVTTVGRPRPKSSHGAHTPARFRGTI